MSIARLTRSFSRFSMVQRPVHIQKSKIIPAAYNNSFIRHYSYTIPDTKDADSIMTILEQVNDKDSKTASYYNDLLKQLASQGRSVQAQKVYDEIFREHEILANIATYSQLMLAYINDGKYEEAMEIYYELRDHEDSPNSSVKNLQLDAKTYGSMISSLTDIKNMVLNKTRFDPTMEPLYEYSVEDVDSAIYQDIEGDSQPSLLTALTLFNDMRHLEIQPSSEMYISMLKSCAEQKDGYVLEKIHKLIRMDLYLDPDIKVFNHLMNAYNIVGDGSSVLEIWDTAESSNNFDQESVSIVLNTCLQHGFITRLTAIWNTLKLKNQLNTEKTLDQLLQEGGYKQINK